MPPDRRRNTLPRSFRLRGHGAFDAVFQRAARASNAALLVVVRENDAGHPRIGVSIGRKFGDAPRRNRAKRLLREAFRLERHAIDAAVDVVFVPRAPGFPDALIAVALLVRDLVPRAIAQLAHPAPPLGPPRPRRRARAPDGGRSPAP